jgi:SAM-dependent methyltransferase
MQSQLCTQEKLTSGLYQDWAKVFGLANHIHRKTWEWVFICEALYSSGVLKPGKSGLGFAVGKEPLASVFASKGAEIIATDLDTARATKMGWLNTNEHAATKAALNERKLCDELEFNRLVNFQFADMNQIPAEFNDTFDFTWSSCAFEHLGSIQRGIDFVSNSMKVLKPGGVSVHTTEFNVCSNNDTVESGDTVIFRRRDIEELIKRLTDEGYHVEEMDWSYGADPLDYCVDVPPYKHDPHLKLMLGGYVCTSIGLIVRKRA